MTGWETDVYNTLAQPDEARRSRSAPNVYLFYKLQHLKADRALAKKIARCLEQLEQNPRSPPNIKALKGDYTGYVLVITELSIQLTIS